MKVYDLYIDEEKERIYYVMELIKGNNLRELLKKNHFFKG